MKTFHYKLGHEAFKTITAGEMIALLQKYPSETPLLAIWETTIHGLHLDPEYEEYHHGMEADSSKCLIFDVEHDQ